MDGRDPAPTALLGLYAATALPACFWSGIGLGTYALVLVVEPRHDPVGLAVMAASALAIVARLAGGLATAAFAAWAAWRSSKGDDRLVRPATLAALAFTLLAVSTSVLSCDCCALTVWLVPGVFAVSAMLLVRSSAPGEDVHPGWGGSA